VPLVLVNRTEVLRHWPANLPWSISHRYHDNVAFVSLHIFQVLYDEGLDPSVRFTFIQDQSQFDVIGSQSIYMALDTLFLFDVHRNDHQRLRRSRAKMVDGRSGDGPRLRVIHTVERGAIGNELAPEADSLVALLRRWEDDQFVIVELMIGKRDQFRMARPVVPLQHPLRARKRAVSQREDALVVLAGEPAAIRAVGTVLVGSEAVEEGGRRQLPIIPDHDQLAPASNSSYRVLRADLRRLVHNDQIKAQSTGREILGYRQWTHHKTRF
jgi:hypothetical protein